MTFRRYIQITVLAIAGNIYLPVSGQENLLREFDAFINKENKTFDNRIKQMNKEFADYLEREWIGFPTYTNQPLSIDPDTFFIKKEETKNRKEEIDIPLEKNNDIRSEAGQLIISFFGKSLSFPFTPSLIIPVNNAGEKAVSNAWRKASEMDYTPLLSMLLHYKKELRLNDWGYLQLVQQTAETIYARHNNPNGAVFLTTYLLNQSSFAARMGRIDNRLALLVEINETIYNVPQLKNDRQTLSIFTGQPLPGNATVFTYKESLRFATERISMHISELPLLDGKCRSAVLPHTWQDQPVTVKVDKALIGFLSTIPQTEFTVYARSGTSEQVKDLCGYLKKYIENKSETEAVSLLLDFVQHTFDYQADVGQFGYEKVFFPDEMLYYPYNDCEDRAIFFCRLVRLLLNLPVALVDYPNHIAAAVCFSKPTGGTLFRQNGKEYTLCDPTYINAKIGECMQQFIGIKAKLIIL
ncbi:hypothetical protein [Parabacteroides goldsteinii]|uniref:hypothetical protein n=1 Tax=Parabacteroides goldsteinii TaxID=328812 RepID=UPI00101CFCC2|nr:hypothetical protein [Parabacteroides goldsteinii]